MAGQRRRLLAKDQSGLTVVELLIAIVILALVLTAATTFFIGAARTVKFAQTMSEGTNTASNLMNELTRVIHEGDDNPNSGSQTPTPAFIPTASPTAESLTIFSNIDSYDGSATFQTRPIMVQFSLDSTTRQLIEKRWLPTSSASGIFGFPAVTTTPTSTRTIGGPVLAATTTPSAAEPLFTYIDLYNAVLTPPLTTAQLSTIAAVKITLRVRGGTSTTGTVTVLQSTVRLPNLGFTTGP